MKAERKFYVRDDVDLEQMLDEMVLDFGFKSKAAADRFYSCTREDLRPTGYKRIRITATKARG